MKRIFTLFILFTCTFIYSQSSGITYQAIIYNPTTEILPGNNNANAVLANKDICLRFSIIDDSATIEYQETQRVKTDDFGMVNLLIGEGDQIGGYASNFSTIVWDRTRKKLQVDIDINSSCANFIEISKQDFSIVPYAYASKVAETVSGIVPISNGGTGSNTVVGAKTNLGLNNVDNTSDVNKPISIATQTALNDKAPLASPSLTGTPLSPTAPPGTNSNQIATTAFVTSAIAAATIPDATTTTKGKIKLAGDLGGTADLPIIQNGAVTTTKIASGGNDKVLVTDSTGAVAWIDKDDFGVMADQATIEGLGTTASPFKVKDLGIVTNKLAAAAVTPNKIAPGANNTVLVTDFMGNVVWIDSNAFGAVADMTSIEGLGTTASPFKVKDLGIITDKLAENAVTTIKIANAAVTTTKIASGGNDKVLVTDNTGVVTWLDATAFGAVADMSTIEGAGTTASPFKVKDLGIITAKIADAAVTTAKIADLNVTTSKIADANVTNAKLADLNVTTNKLANAAVTPTKIASGGNNKVLVTDNTGVVAWIDGTAFGAVADMISIEGAGTTASPFKVKDLGIITAKLADGAVTTDKIADLNVTTNKVANNAVETAKIKDLNVTTTKLADAAVTTAKIASGGNNKVLVTDNTGAVAWIDGAAFGAVADMTTIEGAGTTASPFKVKDLGIITAKLADNAVTTIKIANAAVTTSKIADSNVTTTKIADANVTNAKLGADAVTTDKILDGTIVVNDLANNAVETAKIKDLNVTTNKLANAAVTTAKIASGGNNKVLVTDNTGVVAWIDGTAFGAVADQTTIEGAGTTASPFKVKDLGIITAKLADNAVTTIKIADAAVTTSKIADSNVTTTKIADANVTNAKLGADAVTTDKILDGTIVVNDLANNAVETAKIKDLNVTTNKLANAAVTTAKIASGGNNKVLVTDNTGAVAWIDGTAFGAVADQTTIEGAGTTASPFKVKDLGIITAKLADNAVTTIKIADAAVTTAKIADSNVTTTKIADSNVTTSKIADSNVTTSKLADANVTTSKLASSAVTSAKILDGTILNEDIADNTITTDKIAGQIAVSEGGTGSDMSTTIGYVKQASTGANFTTVTTIPVNDVIGAVRKVNGTPPNSNGEVTINWGTVYSGTLANIGTVVANPANGDTYVIANDSSTNNGRTFIYDGSTWLEVTPNQAALDARYLRLSGDTMQGDIVIPTNNKIILTDVPTNATDAANKAYVDAQITNATPDASNSVKGKIQLGGDLGGSGTTAAAPVISNNAITTAKLANLNVTTTKLADAAVTTAKIASGGNNKVLVTDNTGAVAWIDATAFGAVADMTTIEGAGTTASPFKVKDLGIITAKLADNAVTTIKIADEAVTTSKIADASVATAKIIDGNITTNKLANAAVTTAKIASGGNNKVLVTDNTGVVAWIDGTAFGAVADMTTIEGAGTTASPFKVKDLGITTAKLADNAVTTVKIADANVTNAKLGADAVTTDKILDGTIVVNDLANNAVETAKIKDLNVTTNKLADAAVTTAKIASGGNNKVLVTDNTGAVAWIDGTAFGAVADMTTIEGAGTTASPFKVKDLGIITAKLADNAVTTIKIADAAVTTSKIADSNVTTTKIADANVTNAKLGADAVTTDKILDGTIVVNDLANNAVETAKIKDLNVTTTKLADAAVTTAKIASGGNNKVLVTDNTGAVAWIDGTAFGAVADMTTIEGAGTTASPFKVKDLGIITAKLADNAVTTIKIADAAVTTAKIADSNVTTTKIADANVTTSKIADSNVTTSKLADANVTTSKIANAAVTTAKIASGGNSKVLVTDNTGVVTWIDGTAFGAVADMTTIEGAGTTASPFKVKDLGIITAKLADNAVTTDKILDGTIVVGDLADNAVESAKIKDLNVTTDKLAAGAVTTAKILNGTILNEDIADNTITTDKIAGQIAVSEGGTGSDMSTTTGYVKQASVGANFTTVTSIPVADVAGAVQKVNGNLPDRYGNVSVDFGTVSTGILSNIPLVTTPGLTNGDIYVVSGDSNPLNNGLTYIFDGSQWQEVTPNQASLDARYLRLAGGTMQGDIVIPATKKITLTDAPITATDAVNKAYVDAQITNATPDASTSVKGKIQLGGDLAGIGTTAATPIISDNAITNNKIIADAVTTDKIQNGTIIGADLANGIITNAKLAETITVPNGGTGATTLTGYVKGNGTNSMTAVATIPVADIVGAQTTANLASDITSNTGSTTLYPSVAAVEAFVANNATPDATTSSKGKIKLAGDLAGTADLPSVPGLLTKAPIASPSFTGTPLAPTATAGTNNTQIATTEFVTTAVAAATIPDASNTVKGKIQLAGDLAGSNNAANPTIAPGVISTIKLADNAVTTVKITDANVTTAKIAADAITNAKLADNAVQTENIVDANITTAKIADANITTAKIAAGSNNTVMVTDNTGAVSWIDRSTFGAVADQTTVEGAGTTLSPFKVKDGSITTVKLADNAVTTNKIIDDAVTTAKITAGAITTVKLADNAVTTVKITDANVTTAKIAADAITNAKLADNAVQTENIVDANITTAKIADANITTAKIAAGSNNTVMVTDNNGAVSWIDRSTFGAVADQTTVEGAGTTLSPFKVKDGSITTAKLADNAVTTNKINDDAVTTSKITGGAITNVKLADNAVTNTKLAAASVTNAKIGEIINVANGGTGSNMTATYGYVKQATAGANFTTTATIPVAHITGAVKTVNGTTPDSSGNVTVTFGTVFTGTLASRSTVVATPNNGDIYVVSNDSNTLINGNTFIYDGAAWQEVTANQASLDARYLKLAGGTMQGDLVIPTGKDLTIADAPSNATDATNKAYVDAQVAAATIADATTSLKGKIQLAGDLGGTAAAPLVNKLQGTAVSTTAPTTGQVLQYDGTNWKPVNATSLVKMETDEFSATAGQTSFTLTTTPIGKIAMFINGVRVPKTAIAVTGTTVSYTNSNNGGYILLVNDRVTFDYITN